MVTYNSDEGVRSSISSIINQIDKLIIVDNGSNIESLAIIKRLCEDNDKIKVIQLFENKGIAYALNIGINYAIKESYDWVLTLDHDSVCTKNMINTMLKTYNMLPDYIKKEVYVITPYHIEEKVYEALKHEKISTNWSYKLTQITSGTLAKVDVYKKVLYNEDLFIDLVDHDFCLAINNLGMKIIQVNSAILKHNLGDSLTKSIFGIKFTPTNHSPLRRYYMTRNRLYVWKKFWRKYPKWVILDIRRFISEGFKICIFESNRKEKIKMILLGLKHYKYGKMGRYCD